jgi:hypothetical protein
MLASSCATALSLLACGDDSAGAGHTVSGGAGGTAGAGAATSTGGSGGASGGSGAGTTSTGAGGDGGTGGDGPLIHDEVDGLVAVEAEHFDANDDGGTARAWYLTTTDSAPVVPPDPDAPHADTASGSACIEGLPDSRVTDADALEPGVNFFATPGDGPTLTYRVHFDNPGTYYVWIRAFSTGTEDNGVHAGIDGTWPASGERVQFCEGKNQWTWSSAQRDAGGTSCGLPNTITLEVPEAGEHLIALSMREDGFEIDKWIMTDDLGFVPEGAGPPEVEHGGQ